MLGNTSPSVGLVVSGRNKEASVILCITSGRLLVPVENHDCICVAFCTCGFVCKWLYTRLIQSIRVLSECDYVS